MTGTMTIYNLKTLITGRTNILQHRQKLIGLSPSQGGQVTDETKVEELKVKKRKVRNTGNRHEATLTTTKD